MSNAGSLTDRPKAELVALARRRGLRGWDTMNKDSLVRALSRADTPTSSKTKPHDKTKPAKSPPKPAKPAKPVARVLPKVAVKATRPAPKNPPKPAAKSAAKVTRPAKPTAPPTRQPHPVRPAINGTSPRPAVKPTSGTNGVASKAPVKPATPVAPVKSPTPARPAVTGVVKPLIKPPAKPAASTAREQFSPPRPSAPQAKDRIYLAVNDPYWLHVMWDLSAQSVQRAEAALKQDWYGAKLILRLFDVTSHDTTSTSETPLRDVHVEGDGRNWYIQVAQPPRQYRVDIGYLSRRGDFFPLAKSNVVTPPKAGSAEALDVGWEKDPKKAERILAMSTGFESAGHPDLKEVFEERYGRSLGPPKETAFGSGATPPGSMKKFFFDIGAKLIVYGRTDPTAHVTLGNDPLDLNANGTFVMEFSLPDSRQIIPAVATSADGVEERTIVLAVERNTKYLDPMIHDQMNEV